MEYINELFFLGIDALILGICVKEYITSKRNLNSLKVAPQLSIDSSLKEYVESQPNHKVPYAVIRGTVTPIGTPMKSVMSPSVTAVLQVMRTTEHRVARGFAGFWAEQNKLIHVSTNEVPFSLTNGGYSVEIINGLSAEMLDLDVVHDNYEPTNLSFFDHMFGFFSGVRQKGYQTTEEVLREGSFITAVGEIEADGNNLRLQTSPIGPMLLTTATKNTILKKMEEAKTSTFIKIIFLGSVSVALIGLIARKFYLKKRQEKIERDLRDKLEKSRQERRAKARQQNLTDEQKCVVCVLNPKEVIVLPCGHVCLCEDCAIKIKLSCPVCRTKIDTKAAAFIS